MKRVINKQYKNQRFEGLVKQYLSLMNNRKALKISKVNDSRNIWDNLLRFMLLVIL